MLLLVLLPLHDIRPGSTLAEYEQTRQLFVHGFLENCQLQAERGYLRARLFDPHLASRYQLLEAETMLWRGLSQEALGVLSSWSPSSGNLDDLVRERTLEGVALSHLQRYSDSAQRFAEADSICNKTSSNACGGLLRAQGVSSISRGDLALARTQLLQSLSIAQRFNDRFAEATANLNLGVVSLHSDRYDEALDWSNAALKKALSLGAEDLAQNASANSAWSYFKLGDSEKALDLFLQSEKKAKELGDAADEIKWLTTIAYIYENKGDLQEASDSYLRALARARKIDSKEDVVDCLEDLAHISIEKSEYEKADSYLALVMPMIRATGNRLDALDVMLAQATLAAARHRDRDAESLFRIIENDPVSQTSMRLGAEHQLALLFERQGNTAAAARTYRAALETFESARDQLKSEDSKLPFLANATSIYDDYIHFLITQHKPDDALLIADQSRALTLAQGLGIHPKTDFGNIPKLNPTVLARKTGATLLFYWLGAKQSYLWTISAKGTSLHSLPPGQQIKASIDRYRATLQGFDDPLDTSDREGRALYDELLYPASASLPSNGDVIVLSDGPLSQLNFETLIVPGPHPHYFIEDATVSSAPSLQMLASTRPANTSNRKLLLIGDAISPGPDYPNLPLASTEMQQIQQQVGTRNATLYARENATPAAYLGTSPQQFAYVHFVAHGVASPTDPLDSAIILSRSSPAEDSFKLHARDIIQHPIGARLVTVSACYGSGARSFAGEGPVGLAWAFLRAGAHNVIGALWEVSDQSAPQMMSDLYRGLNSGLSPDAALRQAKLRLLHSNKEFRKPFYWAPLQLYTGL